MVFAIVFIVLFAAMFKHWLEYRQNAGHSGHDDATDDRVRRLEERVEVLERIVTDSGYDLRRELSRLED